MAKDFFDEEYDEQLKKEESRRQMTEEWYNRPSPEKARSNNRPLYVTLICLALVLCIGLGWLMCWVVQSISSDTADKGNDILSTVIDYMQQYYYKDIDDAAWIDAIEASGSALMQSAGDQYSRLLSPQSYYDLTFPEATTTNGKVFGVSFLVEEGIGIYVSSVIADSPAFGKLQEGDIVLKLGSIRDANGNAPVVDGVTFDQMDLGKYTSAAISNVLAQTDSATFYVLREDSASDSGFTTIAVPLQRDIIPSVNSGYNFQFVEFYFGEDCTNVSTAATKPSKVAISTAELRHLDELHEDTGYVRLNEFMYYSDDGENIVSASDEFTEVMNLFKQKKLKHLILDLKGNPGGRVDYAADILAKLITDTKLDADEQATVSNGNKLVITYLDMPKPSKQVQYYYRQSEYYDYFGTPSEVCDIAVWTDGNSASASELVTGCLLDYKTAVHMGTTTYGKGIAQNIIELPFSGTVKTNANTTTTYPWAFYYTCASYYSPLGVNIHGKGYTPKGEFNNLTTYKQLVDAVNSYWG